MRRVNIVSIARTTSRKEVRRRAHRDERPAREERAGGSARRERRLRAKRGGRCEEEREGEGVHHGCRI